MRFFAIPADFGTPERSECTPCGLTENGFGPFGNLNYRTNGINRTRIDVCLILRWLLDYNLRGTLHIPHVWLKNKSTAAITTGRKVQ